MKVFGFLGVWCKVIGIFFREYFFEGLVKDVV